MTDAPTDLASWERQLADYKALPFNPIDAPIIAMVEEHIHNMKSNPGALVDYKIRLIMEARGK
jgi:hypothetical protein